MQRRAQRIEAGIGDRSRRQAGVPIGIVWIVAIQIGPVDRAAVTAIQQRRIDRGRVAIEFHADAQPVFEDRGDQRAFLGQFGFALHHRRQGDGVMYIGAGTEPAPNLAKFFRHHAAQRFGAWCGGSAYRCWERDTLQAMARAGRDRESSRGCAPPPETHRK